MVTYHRFAPIACSTPPNPFRDFCWFAVLTSIGLLIGLSAANANGESLSPSSDAGARSSRVHEVLADALDGSLDKHSLIVSGLIASGADESEIPGYVRRWEALVREGKSRLNADATLAAQEASIQSIEFQKALVLLRLLHHRVFDGDYVPCCGDLRSCFDHGEYNCVTATLLSTALCRRCGVELGVFALPGHVYCQVGHVPIETTDVNGMPGKGSMNRQVAVAPRNLNDAQLLGKLLYNQGLTRMQERDYAAALDATELSCRFDPHHIEARENVAAIVNNWALRLSQPGSYEKAIRLLRRGQSVQPSNQTLITNEKTILQSWWRHASEDGNSELRAKIRSIASNQSPESALESLASEAVN